jgi:hypothetical protein
MSDGPMWQFLTMWHVIKKADFGPRYRDNYDEDSDEE